MTDRELYLRIRKRALNDKISSLLKDLEVLYHDRQLINNELVEMELNAIREEGNKRLKERLGGADV